MSGDNRETTNSVATCVDRCKSKTPKEGTEALTKQYAPHVIMIFKGQEKVTYLPLPNHMYFETDFKVFKMYFQYLNTIFLYFNPI